MSFKGNQMGSTDSILIFFSQLFRGETDKISPCIDAND